MGGHTLCPELMAGVPGTAHAHCLCIEDVDLDEAAGCQLLKTGPVHHRCALIGFIKVHPSLLWVILTNILDTTQNYSSDNRQ